MPPQPRDDWHRPEGRRGVARPVTVVAALLVVVAGVAFAVQGGVGGGDRPDATDALHIVTDDDGRDAATNGEGRRGGAADPDDRPPAAADVDPLALPDAGGVWRDLPPAPVETPARHAAAWTGDELVVVGADRAAAFDPDEERWRPLPASDVVPAAPLAVAWTGRELLVWGDGEARPDAATPAARGARYDPETRTWRRTAWLDLSLGSWPVAVWTGERMLVWGVDEGAAYDPRSDSWQPISPPPLAGWSPADAVWTGAEVIVWGDAVSSDPERGGRGRAGFTAAYEPVTDDWRFMAPSPLSAAGPGTAVWTGEDVVVLGGQRLRDRNVFPESADLPAGALLNVASGTWRIVPAPPGFGTPARMEQLYGLAIAWTGDAVVAVGGYPEGAGLRYDPDERRWSALPSGAVDLVLGVGAWTGERFLVWGGYGPQGPGVALSSWEPG